MEIKLTTLADAPFLARYYTENSEHLSPWEPSREEGYHDEISWTARLKDRETEQRQGHAAYFVAYANDYKEIMAVCNLTLVVRGPFQACFMGYSVAYKYEGQGVMKKLCIHALNHAFEQMQLNRVMANHMPGNVRSARLLKSIGFEKEGIARKYLRINGKWEDHVLNSIVNPNCS